MTNQRPELEFELPPNFADCGSNQWHTLTRLRLVLMAAASATTSPVLALSLNHVEYGGAALMGVLLETHHRLKHSGRRLQLRNIRWEVALVLETCNLHTEYGTGTCSSC